MEFLSDFRLLATKLRRRRDRPIKSSLSGLFIETRSTRDELSSTSLHKPVYEN